MTHVPLIVGIGGTPAFESSTERALKAALTSADACGARTLLFGGVFLARLPHYDPKAQCTRQQIELADAVGRADGVILASPSYHGALSGLLKNALDTLELLRESERPYLDGRAVGCIVTSAGRQAAGTTLTTLRTIVHAMRGWPTPFAAALDGSRPIFDAEGAFRDPADALQVATVARQVADFSRQNTNHTVAY